MNWEEEYEWFMTTFTEGARPTSRNEREVLESDFLEFVMHIKAEAWDECADVAGDLIGKWGEPFAADLRDVNPFRGNT